MEEYGSVEEDPNKIAAEQENDALLIKIERQNKAMRNQITQRIDKFEKMLDNLTGMMEQLSEQQKVATPEVLNEQMIKDAVKALLKQAYDKPAVQASR